MNKPKARDGVEDHYSSSAEELLDVLSPRHRRWSTAPSSWIFRGQADAEWFLKPKAVRGFKEFERVGIVGKIGDPGGRAPWGDRIELQNRLLARFRQGLDRSGLPIPTRSPRVYVRNEESSNAEPLPEAFPLMALAQHHGLPTTLLDWTRRSYVAAYFAAADAADPERVKGVENLAVWAFLRTGLSEQAQNSLFYEAPGGTNPNLRAQAGLFTKHFEEDDASLEEHLVRHKHKTGWKERLLRFVLPIAEAPRLLRLLHYEGVDGASMFPGADGVVRISSLQPVVTADPARVSVRGWKHPS